MREVAELCGGLDCANKISTLNSLLLYQLNAEKESPAMGRQCIEIEKRGRVLKKQQR